MHTDWFCAEPKAERVSLILRLSLKQLVMPSQPLVHMEIRMGDCALPVPPEALIRKPYQISGVEEQARTRESLEERSHAANNPIITTDEYPVVKQPGQRSY